MLINQRELRRLAESSTLMLDVPRRALVITIGIVQMQVDGLIYRATTLSHLAGYRHMLTAIASSFAREENMQWIEAHGRTTRVRDYGPIQGLRRRGDAAYRRLLKAGRLTREQADSVLDSLRAYYSAKVPRDVS